tara:strand:- start:154 stop:729 length:576 start_codon:yes stop_codon:yes gene_type:complete
MAAENTLGNMASYAAAGNTIAPGIGAVIGGLVGLGASFMSSKSQANEANKMLKKIQHQQKTIGRSISKAGEGYQAASLIAEDQFERGKQELEKQLQNTTQSTMSSFDIASASGGFEKSGQVEEMMTTQTEEIAFAEESGTMSLQDQLYQSLAQASTQMKGTQQEGLSAITELESERKQYEGMDTWQENLFG